jgi:hypothetical protein
MWLLCAEKRSKQFVFVLVAWRRSFLFEFGTFETVFVFVCEWSKILFSFN